MPPRGGFGGPPPPRHGFGGPPPPHRRGFRPPPPHRGGCCCMACLSMLGTATMVIWLIVTLLS